MGDDENPWPLWAEQATKGDLIRAIVYMRAVVHELSSAVIALTDGNDQDARRRILEYFDENKQLSRVLAEIGGGEADG